MKNKERITQKNIISIDCYMKNKIEHLKTALNYLENRIHFLDTKANIFIAIEIGLFGIVTYVYDKYFPENSFTTIFLAIIVITFLVIIGSLLQTIRPTHCYLKDSICEKNELMKTREIIWPNIRKEPDRNSFEQISNSSKHDETVLFEDLRANVFNLQLLIYKKYLQYRTAVQFIKVQLIIIAFLFLIRLYLVHK